MKGPTADSGQLGFSEAPCLFVFVGAFGGLFVGISCAAVELQGIVFEIWIQFVCSLEARAPLLSMSSPRLM